MVSDPSKQPAQQGGTQTTPLQGSGSPQMLPGATEKAGFLQDDNGNKSSIRLALLIAVLSVLAVWIYASFVVISHSSGGKFDLPSIPGSVTTLVSILAGGKVLQKFGEKEPASPTQTTQQNEGSPNGQAIPKR